MNGIERHSGHPGRVSTVAVLVAALLLSGIWSLASAPSAAALTVHQTEAGVVHLINQHRRANGLPRVEIDVRLTRAARWMSRDMAAHDYFSHTDRLGRSPFDRIAAFNYPTSNTWRGENLAAGNAGAQPTFTQWLNSPGHNANMLHREFRAIGVARVYDASSTYGWYWTTTFGSRLVQPANRQQGGFAAARARFTPAQRRQIMRTSRGCHRLQQRRGRMNRRVYQQTFRRHQCGRFLRLGRQLGYIPR